MTSRRSTGSPARCARRSTTRYPRRRMAAREVGTGTAITEPGCAASAAAPSAGASERAEARAPVLLERAHDASRDALEGEPGVDLEPGGEGSRARARPKRRAARGAECDVERVASRALDREEERERLGERAADGIHPSSVRSRAPTARGARTIGGCFPTTASPGRTTGRAPAPVRRCRPAPSSIRDAGRWRRRRRAGAPRRSSRPH